MKADLRQRLTQSIETGDALAEGLVGIDLVDGDASRCSSPRTSRAPSTASRCPSSSRGSSPSTRRTAPARAAPVSARSWRSTPTCSSRPGPLDRRGRARAVGGRQRGVLRVGRSRRSPTATRSTPDTPWRDLDARAAGRCSYRHERRPGPRRTTATGWAASASTRWRSRGSSRVARSAATARPTRRSSASGSRSTCRFRPCPVVQGRAAQARGARGHRRRAARSTQFTQLSVTRALQFLDELEPDPDRGADRAPDREGDPRAADVPRRRRRRLPPARPRGEDALGRRGAAAAARDADRLAARRRALHPRRAVDRAPPARQRPADRRRSSGCAISATPCSSSSTTSR